MTYFRIVVRAMWGWNLAANQLRPTIDYRHVMKELSVNRNNSCEVVRELISNGYDAEATNLWVIPLIDLKGLVFIDDGIGVSSTDAIRDITPWQAFFSIGRSTKQFAQGLATSVREANCALHLGSSALSLSA
jgi:hypothetical protein